MAGARQYLCTHSRFPLSYFHTENQALSERFVSVFCFSDFCFVLFLDLLTTDIFTGSVEGWLGSIGLALLFWMEQREDVPDNSGPWKSCCAFSVLCRSVGWGGKKDENSTSDEPQMRPF